MGMDVYGRKAANKDGEYFKANVWSWRPLQTLMIAAGCEEAKNWGSNDGLGLNTQKECNVLADQLESYVKRNPETTYSIPLSEDAKARGLGIDEHGTFGRGSLSPYSIDLDHVRDFIKFLRACGGFTVC